MDFKNILRRYHVSPLQYEDGVELDEKDYHILFNMYERYQCITLVLNNEPISEYYQLKFGELIAKVKSIQLNSIFPLTNEEIIDIIMEQNDSEVL